MRHSEDWIEKNAGTKKYMYSLIYIENMAERYKLPQGEKADE